MDPKTGLTRKRNTAPMKPNQRPKDGLTGRSGGSTSTVK